MDSNYAESRGNLYMPTRQLYAAAIGALIRADIYEGDAHVYVGETATYGPFTVTDYLTPFTHGYQPDLGSNDAEQKRMLKGGTAILSIKLGQPTDKDQNGFVAFRPMDVTQTMFTGLLIEATPNDWPIDEPLVVGQAKGVYQPIPNILEHAELKEFYEHLTTNE